MALKPVITVLSSSADSITVKDNTGNYSSSNTGGFGSPNPASADVEKIILRISPLSKLSYTPHTLNAVSDLIGAASLSLTPEEFSLDQFDDGVFSIMYDLCTSLGNITITPGEASFNLSNADTVLDGVHGLLIPSLSTTKIWIIDRTKTVNSTGGFITENWPSDISPTQAALKVWEEAGAALITDEGEKCLGKDLALWSDRGCEDDNFKDVWMRYKMTVALKNKFDLGCIQEADEMARKLADYCNSDNCDCGCS